MTSEIFNQFLRELHTIYNGLDSSEKETKRHILSVRNTLSSLIEIPLPATDKKPGLKPVCRYLERAINTGRTGPFSTLCETLIQVSPYLGWEYGYETIPDHLYDSYAYTEIAGPKGSVYSENIAFGLVLLAPGCHYPEHSHPDIEESYLCVSGSVTQNNNDVVTAGDILYNPPGYLHSLSVDAAGACLLAYSWNAPAEILRNNSMKFD